MNLNDQILQAERDLYLQLARIDEQRELIRVLKSYRNDCEHVFTAPIPGYEHEGGTCINCGINELAVR